MVQWFHDKHVAVCSRKETRNVIGDMHVVEQPQNKWVRIVMLGENQDAWPICMEYRITVGRNTSEVNGMTGMSDCKWICDNDVAVSFEHNGVGHKVKCPGIVDMLALHVGNDRFIVGRGGSTVG